MTGRIAVAMVLIGLGVLTIGVSILGLFRLRDALERLHAGAISDTLGLLLILSGLGVLCGPTGHAAKLALLLVILWVINPVATHLIARMELLTGYDIDADNLNREGEHEL